MPVSPRQTIFQLDAYVTLGVLSKTKNVNQIFASTICPLIRFPNMTVTCYIEF